MGNCNNSPVGITVSETAITLPQYRSAVCPIFEDFDMRYNFLDDIPLFDFLISLQNLKFIKKPKSKEYFGSEDPENIFQSFIEREDLYTFLETMINKHPRHYNEKNPERKEIFTEYFKYLLENNILGQKEYYKNNSMKDKFSDSIKKYMIIQIGLLFCASKDMDKVNTMFNCISDENGKIKETEYFNLFVYMLIYTASCSNYLTVCQIQENYNQKLPTINTLDKSKYEDFFGMNQIKKAFNAFKEDLFKQKKELSYDNFYLLIQQQSLAWILTLEGIRKKCSDFR